MSDCIKKLPISKIKRVENAESIKKIFYGVIIDNIS